MSSNFEKKNIHLDIAKRLCSEAQYTSNFETDTDDEIDTCKKRTKPRRLIEEDDNSNEKSGKGMKKPTSCRQNPRIFKIFSQKGLYAIYFQNV